MNDKNNFQFKGLQKPISKITENIKTIDTGDKNKTHYQYSNTDIFIDTQIKSIVIKFQYKSESSEYHMTIPMAKNQKKFTIHLSKYSLDTGMKINQSEIITIKNNRIQKLQNKLYHYDNLSFEEIERQYKLYKITSRKKIYCLNELINMILNNSNLKISEYRGISNKKIFLMTDKSNKIIGFASRHNDNKFYYLTLEKLSCIMNDAKIKNFSNMFDKATEKITCEFDKNNIVPTK